ncbi:chromatin assembly factor 1 subunit A [Corythoichthys intestinalis]|uniref:chromatin assembly factor 1 subunit A n=1 Tax=Corythoichthys intestinalis TaxID=161448 RepID=UPI0025A5D405|nr:chromatin assembly factor 1 subunit A [Corythoichthys intestinalis]XP_061790834.1 chromatin assembly factor 1 subunit A [Nerophis lumbriciformis]
MLAAEAPSMEGHLAASTPRRRGMDCTPNKAKKLIQARLPFKRMNSEPKERKPSPKRPCAHVSPEQGVSDRENDNESSPLVIPSRPPLVNGRGPLDCFLSKRSTSASGEIIIDLTDDSPSPVKLQNVSVTPRRTLKERQSGDKNMSLVNSRRADRDSDKHTSDCTENLANKECETEVVAASEDELEDGILPLDTTQESDSSEHEEENASANVSSLGNKSASSNLSGCFSNENSPQRTKKDEQKPTNTPTKEPTTTPKIPADKKKIRRSLKSPQEQEERLRLRQEKERQKEEAKVAKEKKREESRKLKEEREREKQEKKEKGKREKREKKEKEEREKAEKLKAKEEQRKSRLEAKLEEKRKKEEEKRMKDEEKRVKEEKDRLKAEKAEITRFLQKPKIQQAPKTLAVACGKFAPFEIKDNMCMAPLCRVQCEESALEELDRCLSQPSESTRLLKDWISQKPRSYVATRPRVQNADSDCIAMTGPNPEGVPDRKLYGPMKLLLFRENHRPAYWGTWRKKSLHISPRCPLRKDTDLLDYEVDSDEEWEEEEPGESLSHSEGEDEEEGGEDDDDNDGFFVPHGYLSDDEGALEEVDGGDLEKQKLQQRLKAREWEELMSTKSKMKLLQPIVRGCLWEGDGPVSDLLHSYAACLIEALPKADLTASPEEQTEKCAREMQLLGQLLPLLHGNLNSSKVIITEFQEFCRLKTTNTSPPLLSSPENSADIPTRIQLKRLIQNNAVYEKRATYRRSCWYVHEGVLSRFGLEALPVPGQWSYLTSGAREESREEAATGSQGNSPTTPQTPSATSAASKRKSTGSMSITKFMKRFSDPEQAEEMEVDGFQADTEDDDEDCIIVSMQSGPSRKNSSEGNDELEVTPSDTAALPVATAAQNLATA